MIVKLLPLHPDQLIEGNIYRVVYNAVLTPGKKYVRKGMFLGLMLARDDGYTDVQRLSAVWMFNGFNVVKEGNLVFTHRINWYRITEIYSETDVFQE